MRKEWLGLWLIVFVGCAGEGGSGDDGGMDAAVDGSMAEAGADAEAGTSDGGPGERMRTAHLVGARNFESRHELFFSVRQCDVRPLGHGCTLNSCTSVSPADDFGPITVSSGSTEIVQTPEASGEYLGTSGSGPLWTEGADVRFQAEGNGFPGFDETLVGPGAITLESPADAFTLPSDGGLDVQWSGTTAGHVAIVFVWSIGSDSEQLRCLRPASDGMATIPQEILAQVGGGGDFLVVAEDRRLIPIDSQTEVRLLARSGRPVSVNYSKP